MDFSKDSNSQKTSKKKTKSGGFSDPSSRHNGSHSHDPKDLLMALEMESGMPSQSKSIMEDPEEFEHFNQIVATFFNYKVYVIISLLILFKAWFNQGSNKNAEIFWTNWWKIYIANEIRLYRKIEENIDMHR